jgi:DNA-binding NarL/FixJ family response regulator
MTGESMSRPCLLLADDHAMLLDGLVQLLQTEFTILGVAHSGRRLIELTKQLRPDVIVMDMAMPSINGIDTMQFLQKEGCSAKILFLSMHADLPLVEEAFRAGASGFVLKTCGLEELVKAIQAVANGASYITPLLAGDLVTSLTIRTQRRTAQEARLTVRQRELLQLLAEGKTMKEAASVMGISTRTAETHKYEIMQRLHVTTVADLIRYAIRTKLVE